MPHCHSNYFQRCGMLNKGERTGLQRAISAVLFYTRILPGCYQLLFAERIFAGNLAKFSWLVFHPKGVKGVY